MARLVSGSGGELVGVGAAHARNRAGGPGDGEGVNVSGAPGLTCSRWAVGGGRSAVGEVEVEVECGLGETVWMRSRRAEEEPWNGRSVSRDAGRRARAHSHGRLPSGEANTLARNTGTAAVRRAALDGFDHMQSPGALDSTNVGSRWGWGALGTMRWPRPISCDTRNVRHCPPRHSVAVAISSIAASRHTRGLSGSFLEPSSRTLIRRASAAVAASRSAPPERPSQRPTHNPKISQAQPIPHL
jgi:hypothetical protein